MSGVTILDRITANWVRLTRFIGIYPGTPYDDQEGQLRYYREGNVDGTLYVARHLIGGTYEWMVVSNYTDEMARDAIGTALVAGNNIDITVSDVGNTITVDVETLTSADVTDFNEAVDDRVSALVVAGTNIDVTYNDGSGTLTIDVESLTSTDITDFAETVRDTMGTALVAGNNIDITVVDGSDTITIDVESLTSADITDFATAVDERARDAVGTALVAGNNIDITVVDGSDTITIDVESLTSADITDFATAVDERARDAVGTALVAGNNIDITVDDGLDTITVAVETLTLADISDVTATATEVNYTTDVTSNIQAQIDLKAPLAGPTFTGTVTADNIVVDQDSLAAFQVQKEDGTSVFLVDTTNNDVEVRNSADLVAWSGNGSGQVFRVDGATGNTQIEGALDHNGTTVGFFGVTPAVRPSAYTVTNLATDRAYDANATTTAELADVLGTLIADLRTLGIVQ
jgi:hypothetical protein